MRQTVNTTKRKKKYASPEFLLAVFDITDIVSASTVVEEFSEDVDDGGDWG